MTFIRKDVSKLVIPILTEQIFIVSMGMINTMMASNLKGDLGKNVVSAIGMVDSLNNLFNSFFSSLAIGGTVVVAQHIGRGDKKNANEAAKQALFSGLIASTIATILIWIFRGLIVTRLFGSADPDVMNNAYTYLIISLLTYPFIAVSLICTGVLRGSGNTKTPAKINIAMNCINITLTYLFLYGIKLGDLRINLGLSGITGAALGIGIARVSGAMIALTILIKGKGSIKLSNISAFKFNKVLLRQVFNVGLPASVESLLFSMGKLITQIFIVGMGTVAMASNSISNSIINMLNIPGNSLSMAATTIVGQTIGKGDIPKARNSLMYMTKFALGCLMILGALSIPFARLLVGLYTQNQFIIDYSTKLIRLNAIATPLWAFSFVLPAGLKGAGDGKYTMVTSISGMWIFRIGLGYVLGVVLGFGVAGVWMAMYVDWFVRGSMYYMRVKKGKWSKHVIIKTSASVSS